MTWLELPEADTRLTVTKVAVTQGVEYTIDNRGVIGANPISHMDANRIDRVPNEVVQKDSPQFVIVV